MKQSSGHPIPDINLQKEGGELLVIHLLRTERESVFLTWLAFVISTGPLQSSSGQGTHVRQMGPVGSI